MRWFARKEPAPAPVDDEPADDEVVEIIATPLAGMLCGLFAQGFTPSQIVAVVQLVETEKARTEARVRAAMSVQTSNQMPTPRQRPSADTQVEKRRKKWARQKRNQRSRPRLVHSSTADNAKTATG